MKRGFKTFAAFALAAALSSVPLFASGVADRPTLHKIASYESGEYNVDGGVMEIIAYNKANGYAYSVNGQSGVLTAIDLTVLEGNGTDIDLEGVDIDVKTLVEGIDTSFSYGDMTSVSVSPDGSLLALALQAEAYNAAGRIAIFECGGDLTANEGEPREGYGEGLDDPAGSMTIVDLTSMQSVTVGFEAFDSDDARDELVSRNVIIMKDRLPSVAL